MVERSGLLNRRSALQRYRGFESLSLRHLSLLFLSQKLRHGTDALVSSLSDYIDFRRVGCKKGVVNAVGIEPTTY